LTVDLKFVKTHEDAILPSQNHPGELVGDTGYDIFSVADIVVPARKSAVVPVGLKVGYIQPGYWFKIEARSGLGFKHSVQPHAGIIDCVPAGTQISTSVGNKNVELLKKEDSVLSYNVDNCEIEEDIVEDVWVVKDQKLLKIETEDGKIVEIPFTKKVLTKKGWKEAISLTVEDEILVL